MGVATVGIGDDDCDHCGNCDRELKEGRKVCCRDGRREGRKGEFFLFLHTAFLVPGGSLFNPCFPAYKSVRGGTLEAPLRPRPGPPLQGVPRMEGPAEDWVARGPEGDWRREAPVHGPGLFPMRDVASRY